MSAATVSRVFNNSGTVSEKTRAKVLAEAERLGFHPNMLGRNLRRQETRIILVMLTSIANTFCSNVIRSIGKEANANGYNIMICATNGSREREELYLGYVKNHLVDGVIILNSGIPADEMTKLSKHYPIVQCNEYVDSPNTPYVSIDNLSAAYQAVEYLIQHGRRRIVYMGVENDLISSHKRFEGYLKALSFHNIPFDDSLVLHGDYSFRHGIKVMQEFLSRGIDFDGVFAISDRMAAGAIKAMKDRHINIPDDVEVIGFDNTDITYIFDPPITTVDQPQAALGKTAFRQMLCLLKGEPCENVILAHSLLCRNSTKKEND